MKHSEPENRHLNEPGAFSGLYVKNVNAHFVIALFSVYYVFLVCQYALSPCMEREKTLILQAETMINKMMKKAKLKPGDRPLV